MHKKVILTLLLTLVSSSFSFSQVVEKVFITKEDSIAFRESTLYVVLGIGSDYDTNMRKVITEHWTFTEYEFIDMARYNTLKDSDSNFFLVRDLFFFELTKDFVVAESHEFFNLKIVKGNGGAFGYSKKKNIPPVGIASVLFGLTDVSYKKEFRHNDESLLQVLVKNLQLQCSEMTPGRNVSGFNKIEDTKKIMRINRKRDLISQSPLYILEKDLREKIASIHVVEELYNGEVYLVTQEKYTELIEDGADANLVNLVYDEYKSCVRIINAKSGEMIYFKEDDVSEWKPAGISRFHIKDWNRSTRLK